MLLLKKIFTTLLLFSTLRKSKQEERNERIKYGSGPQGHKVTLCFDGVECNLLIQMKLNRLLEVDDYDNDVGNAAKNFNNPNFASYDWSAPDEILEDTNTLIIGTRVRLDTNLLIGKLKDASYASFSLIADLFNIDAEVRYGNETINVAAGAMKFSILVGNWPWKSDANKLAFGIKLKVKTRMGNIAPNNPISRQRRNSNGTNDTNSFLIEQLELGDGMIIENPLSAIVDDEVFSDVKVTVDAATDDDGISIDWILPHFNTSLYYDPIMAHDDKQQQNAEEKDTLEEEEGNDDGNSGSSFSVLFSLLILLYSSALVR